MGKVIIQEFTYKNPITMIGMEAGVCWGADITNQEKNYKRGIDCLENEHGRTFEFPDVYMILDEYSARVMREWYTHIGGLPTRLQASTRYIYYQSGFKYVTPPSIQNMKEALEVYDDMMAYTTKGLQKLEALGIPREDSAMGLPLAMETKVVCKHNMRNLIDMSHQRMCTRAYHEFRKAINAVCDALREYSEEWAYVVDHYFQPKCEYMGFCKERYTCGMMPRREEK